MSPKLLMSLLLGIKSGVMLPIAAQAAVSPANVDLLTRRSPIEVEVVDLNQTAAQPIFVANNDFDNQRSNDNQRNSDSGQRSLRLPGIRRQIPLRGQQIRVIQQNNDSRRNNDGQRNNDTRRLYNRLPASIRRQVPLRRQPIRVIQPIRGLRQISR
ncbi:hypothetical protein ACN4EK_22280 [Pantanalinema rosaneae CENA516]|uniref:hypothetical protein n=1 Tax=Pantanalinema rosaneae TaxID=1620701 RepID=UPI003D6E3E18